ncbi:MAG: hypothetical protein WCJ81_06830 [bacterium]
MYYKIMKTLKEYLRTTPQYISLLAQNGIHNIKDFFRYFPRAYEDRKNIVFLTDMQSESVQYTVKVCVDSMTILKTQRGRKIILFSCHDEHETKATINFFYAPYLMAHIKTKQRYLLIGKPKSEKKQIQFWHPELIPTDGPDEIAGA